MSTKKNALNTRVGTSLAAMSPRQVAEKPTSWNHR